jgi:molybdopterin converting factor small subunit
MTNDEKLYEALANAGLIDRTPFGFVNYPAHWKKRYEQATAEYDKATRAEVTAELHKMLEPIDVELSIVLPFVDRVRKELSPFDSDSRVATVPLPRADAKVIEGLIDLAHAVPRLIAIVRERAVDNAELQNEVAARGSAIDSLTTQLRTVADGWRKENDVLRARVAELEASEKRAIAEMMNVVRNVAKELDPKLCDPQGNEDVWLPVRRMRERSALVESAMSEFIRALDAYTKNPTGNEALYAAAKAAEFKMRELLGEKKDGA